MFLQLRTASYINREVLLLNFSRSFCASSCFDMLIPHSTKLKLNSSFDSLKNKYTDRRLHLSFNPVKNSSRCYWNHHVRKYDMTKYCRCVIKRLFHHTPENYGKDSEPVPKLFYVQNPITWLANKLDFGMLKRTWDPQFDEKEFRRGTKQAVSTITKFVSRNLFSSLKGLLTMTALTTLQRDVETSWTDQERRHIGLEPEDIKVAVSRRVRFKRVLEQKFCDVDMVFLALKAAEHSGSNAVIFVEIIARFHRDYTEGCLADWTVSLFRVTRFDILLR